MATAKKTASKPEDLDVGPALDEVEKESKAKSTAKDPKAFRLYPASTFGSRAKGAKRVGSATNKAITADESEAK